jgi:2-C-methyl-D-erythritol 4-phosphate cytidylyltransferase/2-C-methyl-D-erythritol 2,4-cyclodiphosphate synthase
MFRIGKGIDFHKIEKEQGASLPICGVLIEEGIKVIAHSDGDVGYHALTDAILGSIALGDIGDHFPPSDDKWKNCDSSVFVKHAVKLLQDRGGYVVNVDINIIAERPKIKKYREEMRQKISSLLEIFIDSVSVKATTTELLGFIGRGEGIAAEAVCLIKL